MNHTDTMTPTEYAELVRDARAIVAAMERALRRTGAVFAVASVLTVAAVVLRLELAASITSVIAAGAFGAAVLLLVARLALGDAPGDADPAPVWVVESVADGSARPATGSGPATAENGVIPTK